MRRLSIFVLPVIALLLGGCNSSGTTSTKVVTVTKTRATSTGAATTTTAATATTTAATTGTVATHTTARADACPFFAEVPGSHSWQTIERTDTTTCAVAASTWKLVSDGDAQDATGWNCTKSAGATLATCRKAGLPPSFHVVAASEPTTPAANLTLTPKDRVDIAAAIRLESSIDRLTKGPLQHGAYAGTFGGIDWAVGCVGDDCTDGPRSLVRYPGEGWKLWQGDYGFCAIPQPLLDFWKQPYHSDATNCIP